MFVRNKKYSFITWLFMSMLLFMMETGAIAQVYNVKKAEVTFFSEAPLEDIEAINYSAQSILNTSQKAVAFIVPIRAFRFKKPLMQEHFNEKYMESDRYPNATYSGKINEDIPFNEDGIYKVTSTGKLKIHGVEREVTVPGMITIKNGEINLECAFYVTVADYDIEIPRLVFENIAETVLVKVIVTYQPYKKS